MTQQSVVLHDPSLNLSLKQVDAGPAKDRLLALQVVA